MRHLIFATAMVGMISFALPASGFAQTLASPEKTDMACYVGLSAMLGEAEKEGKLDAGAKQNIQVAIFYYAGKISSRHPGKVVPVVVKDNMKEVSEQIKTIDAKSCLDEIKTALNSSEAPVSR